MSMQVGGGGGVKSDINVTPLVDVMLVLLIIMMIIAPLLQKGVDVRLPIAVNRPSWFCEHGPVSVSFASAAHCVGVRLIPISLAKIAAWRCHT